jgi:mRNA interferase RelE/StbE
LTFKLLYHPEVKDDIARLDERLKQRVRIAIETRLTAAPHQYCEPLRKTLKGYWKLRVGDYRVVFKISRDEVLILAIIHRKEVYQKVERRKG